MRHGGDALRGILDQGDFGALGADEPGGGHAHAFIGGQPLVVVQAAELQAVVGQVFMASAARLESGATAAWLR